MIYYHCSACGLDLAEADTYEGIDGEECRVLCGTCESAVEERDTDALSERLAAAEQRATESEQRAERLAALLVGANDDINHVRVRTQRDADRLYAAKDKVGRAVRALTAPATQSDERAAERAVEVAALRVLTAWDQEDEPDIVDAFEALRAALGDPDTSRRDGLASLDATDGAAKEGV